jgi:uncharacterized repeat protein (TIGR03803 family)
MFSNFSNRGIPFIKLPRAAILLACMAAWLTILAAGSKAQTSPLTLTTLCSFSGTNGVGANPVAALVQGSDGNFYGTTSGGGANGYGTVFKITPGGTLTTLCSFTNESGANLGQYPIGGLVQGSDGNFYGTTEYGGLPSEKNLGYSAGTVFRITPSGTLTSLFLFIGDTNGQFPETGLVRASDGNFYGTAEGGGANDCGTVFKITSGGTLTTLCSFNMANGEFPMAPLVQGADGNFYSTTAADGQYDGGTVFQMTPGGTLTTLYSFPWSANPQAGLVKGTDGNFYGTTTEGGGDGDGTIFKITSSGTLTTLCAFSGTNGNFPNAGLVQGSDGNFYGTTVMGGNDDCGTVFRMTPTGTLTMLFSLSPASGAGPFAGLVQGSDGNFYGTTNSGGTYSEGTVFRLGQGSIIPPSAPVITSALNASVTEGSSFSYQIVASNNPTTFGATGLPSGLSVNTTTGLISGTALASGTFAVTISAANTTGTGSATLTLIILDNLHGAPAITSALSATGSEGSAFTYQIAASNNPTSFGTTELPTGLYLNTSTGLISGTPTENGYLAAYISAINAGGTGSAFLSLIILPAPPVITSGSTAYGTIGYGFNYYIYITPESFFFPISFAATGLPPGLGVDASTGIISGTPTASGTFAATITASDAGGSGSIPLLFTIDVILARLNGSYVGLGAVEGKHAALFTITMTAEGAFTGKLTLAEAHYPLKGAFTSYGAFDGTVSTGNATLGVALSVNPSPQGINGTVTVSTAGGTTRCSVESSLLGSFKDGTLPAGLAGRYTVIFPALGGTDSAVPEAPGYGAMTVTPKDVVHIRGKLGDGTAFSTSAQLHADGKTWTLFDSLYAGRNPGSIAGKITFASSPDSDCDGAVDWIKPPQTTGAHYRGGFSIGTDLLAATYASPPLTSGTAAFTLGGGNLPDAAITDTLTISAMDKVSVNGVNNGRITVKLTPGTGAFSGTFHYPGTNKKTSFEGMIYQKPVPTGFGLFLGTDQSGNLEITQ